MEVEEEDSAMVGHPYDLPVCVQLCSSPRM